MPEISPTIQTFETLQLAYDFFNKHLFDNQLPACLVLLHRDRSAYGYFWAKRFRNVTNDTEIDEIALNPDHLDRGDRVTLSTLVHEMVHLKQQHFGKKSRSGYHNRQWAAWMEQVGLMPSHTGQPGGKKTGQSMTHYIIEGGVYDTIYTLWAKNGRTLEWVSHEARRNGYPSAQVSKVKFTCSECGQNAWAKPTAELACAICWEEMRRV